MSRDAAADTVPYDDLAAAGRPLAAALARWAGAPDAVVLAIVRGGVPAAALVARSLGLPLDFVVLRRLFLRGDGSPVCAVWAAGTRVVDSDLAPAAAPGGAAYLAAGLEEVAARNALCRGDAPPRDLGGRTILLVDNGVHSGATAHAAIRSLRALGAERIVVAAPVMDPSGRARVAGVADEVVCLAEPEPFGHVGMWYRRFDVPAVDQVRRVASV